MYLYHHYFKMVLIYFLFINKNIEHRTKKIIKNHFSCSLILKTPIELVSTQEDHM